MISPARPVLDPDKAPAVALSKAIRTGAVAALKRLLAQYHGLARLWIGDERCARSSLHIATDWPGHFPNVATTIATLVSAGADPNARFIGRSHAEAPLHWAASSDDVEAIDALLDAGADIDQGGGLMAGGTPLADARVFAQWNAARRLVERGATTELDDEAALGLEDRIVSRLSDPQHPVSINELSRAFWYACHGGQLAVARRLKANGADSNWVAPWEPFTPLDAARRSLEQNRVDAHKLIAWLLLNSACGKQPNPDR